MNIGITLRSQVKGVEFASSEGKSRIAISFSGKLNRPLRNSIRTSDGAGRELGGLPWEVLLVPASTYQQGGVSEGIVGTASYLAAIENDDYPSDECFSAWAYMDDELIQQIISSWRSGCELEQLHLRLEGLEFGWEPDGSGVVWPIDTKLHLPVKEVSVRFKGTPDPPAAPWPDETPSLPQQQPSPATMDPKILAQISGQLRWLVGLTAFAAALLLFK